MTMISDLNQLQEEAILDQNVTKREVIIELSKIINQTNSFSIYLNSLVEFLAVKGLRLCKDGCYRLDVEEFNKSLNNKAQEMRLRNH